MKLQEMQRLAHENSRAKGFWPEKNVDHNAIAVRLALIHSEVSEALEAVRKSDMASREVNGKPEGFPSELADVVIRTVDLSEALGIDLEAEILKKMAYNSTRPHLHGGKKL